MSREHVLLKQRGISLYTLLAAVVVLGVLTSVLVTSFTGTHSKGQALWALMHNIGQAANQFHLDTSCYPTDLIALFDVDSIQESSENYSNTCDVAIPATLWHGPYLKKMHLQSANDNASTPQFGPKARVDMNLSGQKPFVQIRDTTSAIADEAYAACGGSGSLCRMANGGKNVKYFFAGKP